MFYGFNVLCMFSVCCLRGVINDSNNNNNNKAQRIERIGFGDITTTRYVNLLFT